MPNQSDQSSVAWIAYALMTVAAWGVYGIFLQIGGDGMAAGGNMRDPAIATSARLKAFLFVGVAYFLTAVVAPFVMLWINKSTQWSFPASGWTWSLLAGVVGSIGAFCVLLAFGKGGTPPVVMTIVFAGAPIVNALVALWRSPPRDGWGSIPWQFYLGLALAIVGAGLVTRFKPAPPPHNAPSAVVAPAQPAESHA